MSRHAVTGTQLGPQHKPMGSDGDGDDYESLPTLVAVAIAAFAKHKTHHSYLSSMARTAAVCDMSLLTHEIDGSEGADNPPGVKRTRRVFLRPTDEASSACAEILWYGEPVRVRSRAIAVVDCFARTLSKKRFVNSGFIVRVVESSLPAWFCDPKTHLMFGFGYDTVGDGLIIN